MNVTKRIFVAVVIGVAAMVGIGLTPFAITPWPAAADPDPSLIGVRWVYASERTGGVSTPYAGAEAYVELRPKAADDPTPGNGLGLNGKDGCNSVATAATSQQPGRLTFRGLASTKMYCPPPTAEPQFARIFDGERDYRVTDDMLTFTDPANGDSWAFRAEY
ncbi:META domain-containing protein [Mycobacteriaceae bacterium NPDC060252]